MVREKKPVAPGDPSLAARALRHIRRCLVSGLLLLIPLGITIFVLQFLFRILAVFLTPIVKFAPREAPPKLVFILAFFVLLLLLYLAGVLTRNVLGRRLFAYGERLLLRIPVIRSVYAASKQVVTSLSAGGQSAYKSVVALDFFSPSFRVLGFVAGTVTNVAGETFYKVFIPTAPNPTSGYLVMIPREQAHVTSLTVEEALKIIVSGGVISPERVELGRQKPASPREGA